MKLTERWYWFVYRCAKGRDISGELARLLREQYLPLPELQALQMERLRAVLAHAAAHVPYYRNLFQRIGFAPGDLRSIESLSALPPLERPTIRDRVDDLIADDVARDRLHMTTTSGSTGMPLATYHDPLAVTITAARYWRANLAWGHRPCDRVLRIVRRPDTADWRTAFRDWLQRVLVNDRRWYVETVDRSDLARLVEVIRRWQPRTLRGFHDKLTLIASYLEQQGERLHVPRIVSGAALLTAEDRARFLEFLGHEVFDHYSAEEASGMAFECEAHEGIHVAGESFVIEAITDGRPAKPGELGEVFVTTLTNFAMPLIRYRIGDTLTPVGSPCSCGRTLPLVRMTHGRVLDILSAPDGRAVSPSAVIRVFRLFSESQVAQYQVVQETISRVRIRIVPKPGYSAAIEVSLAKAFGDVVGGHVQLEFEYPDSIPFDPRSKTRPIESKVPLRFDRPAT